MSNKPTSVRCMLLPLISLNLLIPNSAVAEIIGYSSPRQLSDTSEWFPGVVLWRGVYVPVVEVEKLCGLGAAQVGPRTRIAIIYNPEKDPEIPYLGIHMQDIPRAYLAEADRVEAGSGDIRPSKLLVMDPSGQQIDLPGEETVTVLDNLLKGASGQAVQSMNIMCGFAETAGLI